ncbi:MAG TPA: phosphatase PAP2 family protein [Micromonosporaceae bacterium]|nr:phosphatase PAP2 family protein [Micromonosporaceae bacterium]
MRAVGYLTWLALLGAAHAVVFLLVWRFFVTTEHGQLLDTAALAGNTIGRRTVDGLVDTTLNAMSVVSLAIATAVIGFIALIRRRVLLAVVAITLIVGANVTTQVLKYLITRPDLGVDEARAAAGNSLPSGHTTVAASVAIALVLVLPARVRAVGAVIAAGYAALAGVATLSAGWHRPSDAVAALLIAGGWAALAGFLLLLAQHREAFQTGQAAHRASVAVLLFVGIALLAVAVAVWLTDQALPTSPEELSRQRLFAAYAGGAAGIAGTAGVVTGLVLASVHRVVPRRGAPAGPDDAALPAGVPGGLVRPAEEPTVQRPGGSPW